MFLIYAATVLARSGYETPQYDFSVLRGGDWDQFLSNILMFIPVGFLMPRAVRKWPLLWGVLFSCFIELSQLVLRRGLCEIDDVISNSVGNMIGYLIFTAGVRLCHANKKTKESK